MATPKQALGVAAVVVGSSLAVSGAALGGCLASPPASIATNCSSDVGTQLSSMVNTLPANSTVTLKAGGCYLINSTVSVTGRTNLTINANGATLERTQVGTIGTTNPLLALSADTNLKISNVKLVGAYNGSNGGGDYEGNYGLMLTSNHGVSISAMAMTDVQGDFITLAPPDPSSTDSSLNTGVSITDSTFTNAGYHGLTVESVNGLTVSSDTFSDMGVDAMDFEVDTYSTEFAAGVAQGLAQDNITITGDTWNGWQDDWLASLQGQMPGVQAQNWTLSSNTLNAGSPLVEVTGTNPYLTPSQYWNKNLVITGNHGLQPAISTHGSGPAGTESTMQIVGVVGLTIANNTLPLNDDNGPVLSVLQAYENQNMAISGNQFPGAYSILQPGSAANTGSAPCDNHYGVSGSMTDGACP